MHGDGALSLRNCARLSLDAIKIERQPQLVTQLSPTSAAGSVTRTGEDSSLILGTKRVEAVIVSWQLAAGRRYRKWFSILASGAGLHGDGALSLRFNCSRLRLSWPLMLFNLSNSYDGSLSLV